jgi:PHS family inorganic phosphate transporter-like MFS transporter
MLPAEIFPTRYRGTAYGLSAATGKIGSIVSQVILREIMTSTISSTSLVPNGTGRALLL